MNELTHLEKKIVKARLAMLFDQPFFGYLAISLEPVLEEHLNPPTMATDGAHLFYHPDFVQKMSVQELQFVIAHEIMHVALMHLPRQQNREHKRWNYSADYAVNSIIRTEFVAPKEILWDPKFENNSAEEIYSKLQSPSGGSFMAVGTLDDHSPWKDWGKSKLKNGDDENGDGKGGNEADGGNDLEQQWKERVAQAVTQAKMRGNLPGKIKTLVDGVLYPKLDWRTILRDMVVSCAKSDFTMFPFSKKHLYRGFYLPSITGEEIRIGAAIDSSGSISDQQAKDFLAEIKGICDSYQEYTIYLYVCDTRIHQEFELHPFDALPNVIVGRGGTSFIEPLNRAEKLDITSFVYLTDLDGQFPAKEPRFPVIWITNARESVKAPWGTTIHLPR